MRTTRTHGPVRGPSHLEDAVRHGVNELMHTWRVWRERSRLRRLLAGFDDQMLSDIGIDRSTREFEIDKPFWRA